MTAIEIAPWPARMSEADLQALASLWNRSVREAHGFFPLRAKEIHARIVASPRFRPERLLLARRGGRLAGMLHYDVVDEFSFAPAGVVEAVAVHPEERGQGIATRLLHSALERIDGAGVDLVDGLGCYPYTPFYSTLVDGSERSGPFVGDAAMLRLFESAGFRRERVSLVMERPLEAAPAEGAEARDDARVCIRERHPTENWLDHVFRGWRLYDHHLQNPSGDLLSRAIYARMAGVSNFAGRERYALFGVNTPAHRRGQGWAGENLRRLLTRLGAEGGEAVELHVYADNEPAVRLYRTLGFREIDRTVMLRRTRID